MALPRLIEFIESLEKPTGGFIAEHVVESIRYTDFPPGTTAYLTIQPPPQHYAYIGYRLHFSSSIVPEAFRWTIQWFGHTANTGVLTDTILREGLEAYIVVTRAAPLLIYITNISGLVQNVNLFYGAALLVSEEDYNLVIKALAELQNQGVRGDIQSLLNYMRELKPVPPPPLTTGGPR